MMKALCKALIILLFVSLAMSALAEDILKHKLEKGETLYSISRKYNVSYEALAAANGITDPTKMKIGTVLIIPVVHVVAKGETLFGLSRLYNITVNELLSANKLKSDYVLKIGDILVIPGAKIDTASAVPPLTVPSTSIAPSSIPTTLPPTFRFHDAPYICIHYFDNPCFNREANNDDSSIKRGRQDFPVRKRHGSNARTG